MKEKIYAVIKRIQNYLTSEFCFHLVYSCLICLVLSIVTPLGAAATIALGIGIAKEAIDKYTYGLWSWGDLIADITGIAIAIGIRILIAIQI